MMKKIEHRKRSKMVKVKKRKVKNRKRVKNGKRSKMEKGRT